MIGGGIVLKREEVERKVDETELRGRRGRQGVGRVIEAGDLGDAWSCNMLEDELCYVVANVDLEILVS